MAVRWRGAALLREDPRSWLAVTLEGGVVLRQQLGQLRQRIEAEQAAVEHFLIIEDVAPRPAPDDRGLEPKRLRWPDVVVQPVTDIEHRVRRAASLDHHPLEERRRWLLHTPAVPRCR